MRAYQPGDDVRAIDWRVTARRNKTHTKVFREERERPTLVLVDQSQSMFFGTRARLKSVAAAEIAAVVGWRALAQGDRVGGLVRTNDTVIVRKPQRSDRAMSRLLSYVVEANQALTRKTRTQTDMHDALNALIRLAHSNQRVYLISDFQGQEALLDEYLPRLGKANRVIVVHVTDPLEAELPPFGRYTLADRAARWQFDAGDDALKRAYAERFASACRQIEASCRRSAVAYWRQSTDAPLEPLLSWLT